MNLPLLCVGICVFSAVALVLICWWDGVFAPEPERPRSSTRQLNIEFEVETADTRDEIPPPYYPSDML